MSLSYVHRYHAGHFADIHKHAVLISVLKSLIKKETPFTVLDAFSGEGFYNLDTPESQKLKEYALGLDYISRQVSPTPLIATLLEIIKTLPKHYYPGSPAIIQHFLRSQDSAHLIEKHPQAFAALKQNFRRVDQLHLHERDAYEAMNALIPFKNKRGLVFIDPSYEIKSEYEGIGNCVNQLYKKFSNGIYLIWYPILINMDYQTKLIESINSGAIQKVWRFEWTPFKTAPDQRGMCGSGVIMVNAPWGADEEIINTFQNLKQTVYPDSIMEIF